MSVQGATFLAQPVRFTRSGWPVESKVHLFADGLPAVEANQYVYGAEGRPTALCGRSGDLASTYSEDGTSRMLAHVAALNYTSPSTYGVCTRCYNKRGES